MDSSGNLIFSITWLEKLNCALIAEAPGIRHGDSGSEGPMQGSVEGLRQMVGSFG